MREKVKAFSKFKEFKEKIEKEIGRKIQCLHTSNDVEYTLQKFSKYLHECGLCRQISCPSMPQQNRVTEIKNQHLTEI